MTADLERLRSVCGAECVVPYRAPDAQLLPFLPADTPVVTPPSVEAVQECLRFAAQSRLRVLPAGAMEHLYRAPRRHGCDFVLSTRRLAGITEYEPADFTLLAQAGATLHSIADTTAPARQRLGPQPWPGTAATIGGACAANRNGLGRLGRGTWRDAVLGCRVVHADGVGTKSGGRVVKNVSGFDLAKLYIGSLGSLAILTEVNLRLVPAPEASAVVRAAPPMTRAHELLLAAHRSALQPEAVVIGVGPGVIGDAGTSGTAMLWARFAGRAPVVEAQARNCAALWNGEVMRAAAGESQWQALATFDTPAAGRAHLEFATLPVAVAHALAVVEQTCGDSADAIGLSGVGTFHVRLPEAAGYCLPELQTRLAACGARVRWSALPPPAASLLDAATAPALALQTALKAVFDPEQRLPMPDALAREARG